MRYVCFLHTGARKKEREIGRGIWLGRKKARVHDKFVKRRDLATIKINWDMQKIGRQFRCRILEAKRLLSFPTHLVIHTCSHTLTCSSIYLDILSKITLPSSCPAVLEHPVWQMNALQKISFHILHPSYHFLH